GAMALALAARIFGSDAILYGSEGSWSDLFRRPVERKPNASIAGALVSLAIVTPVFILCSDLGGRMIEMDMTTRLTAAAGMGLLLFAFLPLALAQMQGVELRSGFQLRPSSGTAILGALILGVSLWPLVMELILFSRSIGLTVFSEQQWQEQAHA